MNSLTVLQKIHKLTDEYYAKNLNVEDLKNLMDMLSIMYQKAREEEKQSE